MSDKTFTILVASRNKGKIREIKRIFTEIAPGSSWLFLSADEVGLSKIEETGATFLENAQIKALAAARKSGMIALGEDSGLEVDKLGGAPGVCSHRFSPSGDDHDNNELLLKKLEGVPLNERTARYRCAVVVAGPRGVLAQSQGVVEGLILDRYRGKNGFGYDPLFYCPELGKTFGEATDSEKDRVSHRRRALEGLVPTLVKVLSERSTMK
ncbi:MAG: RdgB/HAM1 family non-canonical purine NTP pyrophosphatase [Candidatus Fermentithermobacillus carboniphilus]|uniref:dITP/XTP pyrophosphatase n=1 Tax=Candidatus Fermentithermobacillus carboniphilus TaxID=3085328 RepID=A0AAT9LGZ2_9FIRM|nr:MAG: RdgB/HAM1 family non-canonical purine NTP pyrophosphatase [Candidatus Fermentithermobacillus carboniphilus]